MDLRLFQLYKIPILLSLSCLAFYFTFGYDLERSDFTQLILLYTAICFLSYKLVNMLKTNLRILIALAVIFRLVFLFALPNLSQDYFRFIWDGRLIAEGWNPYRYIPQELIDIETFSIKKSRELISGMGSLSASNYSNYPPLNQLIFAIGGWLSSSTILGSVIVFRVIIIIADLGTLIYGRKLLKSLGMDEHRIFWYILNPFIIIEMTGNLHFESVMVFFLVLSIYLLHKGNWLWSAVILGLSISVKLLPLLFLPLFFKYFSKSKSQLNFKKLIVFNLVCLLTVLVSFLPFYSSTVFSNFLASVGLWFGKFEFNASIFYVIRWIGYQVRGYNIIETVGKILPLITFLIVIGLTILRKNEKTKELVTAMLFAVTAYLFLSTTVHPWYLAIPMVLSVFTEFKYVLIWSGFVMLSYYAYSNPEYKENLWLIAFEYIFVFGFLVYELFLKRESQIPA